MVRKKILVVDDEYTIRELIDFSLEDDFNVVKAEDGKQALVLAKDNPDLIILDIMMPNMDGYEVCKRLKKDDNTKHIPIIILTAKHTPEDLKEAIDSGADEFMTKPFEPDFLLKRVHFYFSEDANKPRERRSVQSGSFIHFVREKI